MKKNTHGVSCIGSFGYNSILTIGGYKVDGTLRIDLPNGNYTLINYYNDPYKAIPYMGRFYLHDELPAYMVKRNGNWFVGTEKQIKGWYLSIT